MYPNIKAELARKDMTIVDLSNATGISYQSLYTKLQGKYNFTVKDALKIKKALDVDIPIEVLFEQKDAVTV